MEEGLSNPIDRAFLYARNVKKRVDTPGNRRFLFYYLFIVPVIILKFYYAVDIGCTRLINYSVYHNDPCVSSYDHACKDVNVLVVGTSTYMKDVEITSTGSQQMKVSEERNGLNMITTRYTDINIKFEDENGRIITGPLYKPSSYCVQYHLNN